MTKRNLIKDKTFSLEEAAEIVFGQTQDLLAGHDASGLRKAIDVGCLKAVRSYPDDALIVTKEALDDFSKLYKKEMAEGVEALEEKLYRWLLKR